MSNVGVGIGDQVYAKDGDDPFGAVRKVHAHDLLVYIEGTGDVTIAASAVTAVHDDKVIVDITALAPDIQRAITRAHIREEPGL